MIQSKSSSNNKTFGSESILGNQRMTLDGTVNKCFILIFCVMLSSYYTWNQVF